MTERQKPERAAVRRGRGRPKGAPNSPRYVLADLPDVFYTQQLARVLGLAPTTVKRLAREGVIPHVAIGRKVLFFRERIAEWMRTGVAGSP